MDPLTQGVLGAALPQATLGKKIAVRSAAGLGFLAGMAADLDVFIRSSTDPLAFLTYHRHFTHALIFIPVGGLMCALALHWLLGRRWTLSFPQTLLLCTLGYATHAPLDALTSYGTLLYWPFSDERVSLSIISVIDPLFTLPLLIGVAAAAYWKKTAYAIAGLAWAACYLGAALLQQAGAVSMAKAVAAERGHALTRVEAKPSFGNILIWKTIYETADHFYIDAARAGLSPRLFPGRALPKLDVTRDLPWLDPNSQQARDIERFRTFSQGYVAQDSTQPNRIIDVRYSFIPNDVSPLWFIEVTPTATATAHALYVTQRGQIRGNLGALWRLARAG